MRPERSGQSPLVPSRIRSDKELNQLVSKIGAKGSYLEKNIEYFHQFLSKAMSSKNMASFSLAMTLVSTGVYSVMEGFLEKYPEMKDKILNFLRENHQKISRHDLRVIFKNLTGSDKVVDLANLGANNQSKAIDGFIVAPPPVVHPIPAKCVAMLEAGNLIYDKKGNKFEEMTKDEFLQLYKAKGHDKLMSLFAGSPSAWPLLHFIDKNNISDGNQIYVLYLLAFRATVIENTTDDNLHSKIIAKLDPTKMNKIADALFNKSGPELNFTREQKEKIDKMLTDFLENKLKIDGEINQGINQLKELDQ